MLGDSPSRKMDKVALRSCEKIGKSGADSPFRAGQMRIFKRLRGAKKVSGPGFSIFHTVFGLNCSAGLVELRENYGFSRREIKRISGVLTGHLDKLCQAWEQIHGIA